ncbi:MAG TPA: crosslink repair DNA glycosylase YcaQ family protein [Thermoanaerobaculia bacterium]|nr:crosslink repair DNA glycosylase YcaQ family protein [Thermoanaerobaculia bacterium]
MTDATLDLRRARRLALAKAGLLRSSSASLPRRAAGGGRRARRAALDVVERFGYLQLDTVSIAGARSHALVLLSRLEGMDAGLGEDLLRPGEPLFEYWGHEASWIPIDLYPVFAFRRRAFRRHPWWGNLLGEHRKEARRILERVRAEGPLRSVDLEGKGGPGWWNLKLTKRLANALWSSGDLAIRERRAFQRSYDLPERVIPADLLERAVERGEAFRILLLRALEGFGWATTGTLAQTWRLRNARPAIGRALAELVEDGRIVPCRLAHDRRTVAGWIQPADLDLADRLAAARPRPDRGVLLSPFDPLLWDRERVRLLFGFDQVCEIFTPPPRRRWGYFCLPVLAGDRLVARADLKAHRRAGRLEVLSVHFEETTGHEARAATRSALERHAGALELLLGGAPIV